jgi:hypothetical protein
MNMGTHHRLAMRDDRTITLQRHDIEPTFVKQSFQSVGFMDKSEDDTDFIDPNKPLNSWLLLVYYLFKLFTQTTFIYTPMCVGKVGELLSTMSAHTSLQSSTEFTHHVANLAMIQHEFEVGWGNWLIDADDADKLPSIDSVLRRRCR